MFSSLETSQQPAPYDCSLAPGVQASYAQGHTAAPPPVLPVGGSGTAHTACSSSQPSLTVAPPPAAPFTQGRGSPSSPSSPCSHTVTMASGSCHHRFSQKSSLRLRCSCPEPRHAVLSVTAISCRPSSPASIISCRPSSPAVLSEASLSLPLRVSLPTPTRAVL